ncbi:sensor histidine kinase [Undibacterium fentianense]|uniref:Histidine kinase n=1 Tax=Undibacterium fentianense TaxID=2828728 RepID=A0A941IG22_9BURK|nr:histidine kinase [Undibacterium fentianense]MBR7800942.1 histidine kinase [Undibacterium fentianense]
MANSKNHPTMLDQPLPDKLINKLGGWALKAHHYPTFSQTWFRYRALSFFTPMLVLALILSTISLIVANEDTPPTELINPYKMFLALYFGIAFNLLAGRWLATQVKKKQWQKQNEILGIAGALLFGILISLVIVETADLFLDKKVQKTSAATKKKLEQLSKSNEVKVGLVITSEEEKKINGVNILFWLVLLSWWGGAGDFRIYLKQRRELDDARTQEKIDQYKNERNLAQMRLSVLASQVEPHFLFNTLSGVRAAMLSDPVRGVAIIDHLVDYLRSTIPQMRDDGNLMLSTVGNQFDSVRSYLGVIHMRIPRLSYTVECPSDLLDCEIPPLMLISLVENAVKHGIEPKKGAVHIKVRANTIDNMPISNSSQNQHTELLCLSVIDDGVGFGSGVSGSGIGLSNIRERLKHLYAGEARLDICMREEGGTEVRIVLPLSREETTLPKFAE